MFKFKTLFPQIWAFDCEWVPDPLAGRLAYDLPDSLSDYEVMEEMWQRGGATEENPQPFLKMVLCRVVSISAVVRKSSPDGGVSLFVNSLPHDHTDTRACEEGMIIGRFLSRLGDAKPQLIGYNSSSSDLRILIQRGIVNGLSVPSFCSRPEKPWEGPDFFAKESDIHIDLMNMLSGWGRGAPSLHEIATLSGIPGKMGIDGQMVPKLWLEGRLDEIVAYNECDALTTYLVWLRVAHFAGHLTEEEYLSEQHHVVRLLRDDPRYSSRPHLQMFFEEWRRLQSRTGSPFLKWME